MNKVIVLCGPTAAGKTALAAAVAKAFGGELVSADSVQLYKYFNIGSAKPTKEELDGVPRHMADFLEPCERFSVADYCEKAKETIFAIRARGKLPIVEGGAGLYIDSLIENVAFPAEKSGGALRGELARFADENGADALHARLRALDPEAAAAVHPNNVKRVIRALEICETSGGKTARIEKSRAVPSPFDFFAAGLTAPREILYERINRRVEKMARDGLFEEVEALLARGFADSPAMKTIGYKEVFQFFQGALSREETIALIQKNTRNYAKRQITRFKKTPRLRWYERGDARLFEDVKNFLGVG
jgi:tRNA dimethylallyltransferase